MIILKVAVHLMYLTGRMCMGGEKHNEPSHFSSIEFGQLLPNI